MPSIDRSNDNDMAAPTLTETDAPAVRAERFAFLRSAWPLALILFVSALLHFIFFSRPLQVVFDEVYFPRFGLAYLENRYYFDLHPPLGKLIFFVTGWLAGLSPDFSFAKNMLPFPDASYLVLRVPPRLAGTLLPLVLYGIAREIGLSRWAAFVVGMLAALDNGLLVISRFALTDAFLLLFGFSAVWCYLRGRARGWSWQVAAGLLGGAALAIKWTGLSFIGLVLLLEGVRWIRQPSFTGAARMVVMAALAAIVYVASYAVHFALAYRTGPDDGAMSPAFQATLEGNPHANDPALERPGFIGKFVELHQRMIENTRKTVGPHAYASRWYDWPFMMRSVDYWVETTGAGATQRFAHLYFLGNPVVWWAAGYCILYLLVNFPPQLAGRAVGARATVADWPELFIVIAYLANMLPFVGIGRIMFVYHYLPALCFALLGLGLLLDRAGHYGGRLGVGLLVLAAAAFVYFAPLTYGLPLAPADFDARFWLRGWR